MSHMPVGLDLEDMTPKQLRKALSHYARMSMSKGKREKGDDEEDDKEAKENNDLVDLHREKGDSKPPKVVKDDLPEGFDLGGDEDDQPKKKGKS